MISQELRCHACSHWLGRSKIPMECVGVFKPSAFGRIASVHRNELRRRCKCGFVNVFHPERASEVFEVKSTNIRTDAESVEHPAPGPLMAAPTTNGR